MAVEPTEPVSTIHEPIHAPATVAGDEQGKEKPRGTRTAQVARASKKPSWWRWGLPAVMLAVVAAVGAWFYLSGRSPTRATPTEAAKAAAAKEALPLVEVVTPTAGGIERTTKQPGTLHSYQWANLYAKISGYLKTLNVDIGDKVTKGQVLAEIEDPEVHKAVEQARAELKQIQATVKQAEATLSTAKAELEGAKAEQHKDEVDVEQFAAMRVYRESELERYEGLARSRSIEEKLVDEERERYHAAVSAENAAKAQVIWAKAKVIAAEARIEQAKADLAAAQANVEVSQANLDVKGVLADYTKIVSPYDGVVTDRNYNPGDFIRSAADGNAMPNLAKPLLAVARTDKLRVVVQIPDRDVPFVDRGDEATIEVDALPGQKFTARVSRFAESEDPADRTMRTEIDLENTEGQLREGMYGTVTIVLQAAPKDAFTIPSSCLVEQNGANEGSVYVVHDGEIASRQVKVGKDNGARVEILEGLHADDQVVARYSGSISPGIAVRSEPFKDSGAKISKG